MRKSGIYAIRNLVTGRVYIGQTTDFRRRRNHHFSGLARQHHHCEHLQRSFTKHGSSAFEFVELEYCPNAALTEREQHWMDEFRKSPGIYNSAPAAGSVLGIKRTAEHREKIAAALRGKKHTPERIAKVVAATRARVVTAEARQNMSLAARRKRLSPEHRARISDALTGLTKSPEHKLKLSESAKRRHAQCR